jgi:hypothetical protein
VTVPPPVARKLAAQKETAGGYAERGERSLYRPRLHTSLLVRSSRGDADAEIEQSSMASKLNMRMCAAEVRGPETTW